MMKFNETVNYYSRIIQLKIKIIQRSRAAAGWMEGNGDVAGLIIVN